MLFYKKTESGKHWHKNPYFSAVFLLRDIIIYILPVWSLPKFLVKMFYSVAPKFIFFVHPRRTEDAYIALPFLTLIRRFFGKQVFLNTLKLLPPVVLGAVNTKQCVNGLIISSALLPEFILNDRRTALRESVKGLSFSSKISSRGGIFGLGALWPMVTRRGLVLQRYQKDYRMTITNGHSGTLASLFFMIKRIADISNYPLDKLKVAVLGVGKMGTNLARVLYGKVAAITLIDVSDERLNRVESKLREAIADTDIQKYTNREDVGNIKEVLAANHVVVCTTSNLRYILKSQQIPDDIIFIDDSRPEAVPRDLKLDNCIVIEGGLLKIRGVKQYYDFGFGVDENVFGCLAESFLLAADYSGAIQPTLGDVEFNNFEKMLSLCNDLGVEVGDFKCRDELIPDERIAAIIKKKTHLSATIPFKNICWLFKVEDLVNI